MRHRGFTLLELLVTLAIAAILAALALPGYGAIMQRAQRVDARLALLAIQHAEELHFQRFSRYTDALTMPGADGGLGLAAHSTDGSYALTVSTSDDGQRYSATARPLADGRQAADHDCTLFLIDETGFRTAMDARGRDSAAQCWR